MSEPMTCGQGLAEHAVLPASLAELVVAVAENLERHSAALDLADDNARTEHAAYRALAIEHRTVASHLDALARHMASYRDLPPAHHDPTIMASPRLREAFEAFVGAEQALFSLLQTSLARDQQMLDAMRASHPA